ncbi:DUF3531 family protein [Prochlorococcus sp. MIT 1307]|uniref:DUF3531 family protein n=1 Tax=Prochlorococcus sp. MIT 1307 TaxID=3096219 RepID=UPI002A751415|nr:DUF3531 family protein [Prochlorococcus sp. MIT 1307]
MQVRFREVDPFNCWIWMHFHDVPSKAERDYVDGVFDSWYVIGRLGGFNASNLQSQEEGSDLSWMVYDNEEISNTLPSLMHNLGELEYLGKWARCWVDLGTCDAIAIDVLINSLHRINVDFVQIEELLIGGVNEDWGVDDHPDAIFSAED